MTAQALNELTQNIKWDAQGLIPVIIQDAASKDVLTLAYMNTESLKLTLESGETWFWSRSRAELWHKGATSGHTQKVKSIAYDCDADTLLVKVIPDGPACHTGKQGCFFNEVSISSNEVNDPSSASTVSETKLLSTDRFAILSALETTIAQREAERPEGAYTTYLFEKGVDKILKKVGEETAEVIIAAKNHDQQELRYEASDLIFHLMVLLREEKLSLDEIMLELDRRHNKK
jgi:phosphoribosyl-ATP pyrophosphohydrolase/phosphoribosyl-AMP cyclohydrolase